MTVAPARGGGAPARGVFPDRAPLARYEAEARAAAIQRAQAARLGRRVQSEDPRAAREYALRAAAAAGAGAAGGKGRSRLREETNASSLDDEGEQGPESARRSKEGAAEHMSQSVASLPDRPSAAAGAAAEAGTSTATTPAAAAAPPVKKAPAWGAPRSWADLAAPRSSAAAVRAAAGTSATATTTTTATANTSAVTTRSASMSRTNEEGLSSAASSVLTSPVLQSSTASLPANGHGHGNGFGAAFSHPAHAPAKPQPPQPQGLEGALAKSHLHFTAPLTVPRGLVNKGNLCFANSVSSASVVRFYENVACKAARTTKLTLHALCFLFLLEPTRAQR